MRDASSACYEQAAFYLEGCKCSRPDADEKECEEPADDASE
jgi:hypothetical protein